MVSLKLLATATVLLGVILLVWRPAYVRAFFRYIAKDEMPIWLSIALAIAAAVGTYVLAPVINEDLEFQKNRSAHVLTTVNDVNADIVQLSIAVRKFNEALFYGHKDIGEERGNVLDQATKLQWRFIDMQVIIRRSSQDAKCVDEMSKALRSLRHKVIEAKKPEDQESVISAYEPFAESTRACVGILYGAAKIG